jgi:hypothetical protein
MEKLPNGWNENRVKELISYYEQMTDEELLVEDESAQELAGQTVMIIPTELVPQVLELIRKTSA